MLYVMEYSINGPLNVIGALREWRVKTNNNPSIRKDATFGRVNATHNLSTIQEGLAPLENNGNRCQSNRIIINMGGIRFETYKSTLRSFPGTRLAWITETKSDNPDYDPVTGEYFFDRHPSMFLMILNYYRTGKLHAPADVCGPAFEDELAFWGIDEKQIESCCWGAYSQHRDAQQTIEDLDLTPMAQDNTAEPDFDEPSDTAERFGIVEPVEVSSSKWLAWKAAIWVMLNDHSSSTLSKVFTTASLMLTLVVVLTFMLETDPCCRDWIDVSNSSLALTNYTSQQYRENTRPKPALRYIETVCMLELLVEFILRLITCPSKRLFFRHAQNWIDLLTLLSFTISTILSFNNVELSSHKYFLPLQFLRMVRVFKIFNVARHLRGLKILFHTLKASAKELLLMLILIVSLGTVFACLIYLAEQIHENESNHFESIPISFWWAIVTMTTLGYGDKVPKTVYGYVVGMFCAIFGVLFITLPVPIIVNNFSIYYSHAQAQHKLPKKKKNILVGAADLLKQQIPEKPADMETISEDGSIGSRSITLQRTQSDSSLHNQFQSENGYKTEGTKGGGHKEGATRKTSPLRKLSRDLTTETIIQNFTDVAGKNTDTQQQTNTQPGDDNISKPRGSLLPGCVSNPVVDNSPPMLKRSCSTTAMRVKSNARDRRRSILPSGENYIYH